MTHTRLVFLRHGQTEWNLLGKLQGQADIDLDEVGEQQAGWRQPGFSSSGV